MRNFTSKRLLCLSLVVLVLMYIALTPAWAETKRKKITVMLEASESSPSYKMWSEMLESYVEETGTNIRIEYELLSNDKDYANRFQFYVANNALPDIYGCTNGTYSKAAQSIGAMVNIGDELKRLGVYDRLNGKIVSCLTDPDDGQLYLLPNAMYCELFWYRKDKFERYGLAAPKTWDQFLEACRILKEHGETPVIVGGAAQWQLMRYLSFIPWRVTGDGFLMGYINQTDSFAKDVSARKGVNLLAEMGKNGYFQDGFIDSTVSDAANKFFGGEGCIFYSGSIRMASKMYSEGKLGSFSIPAVDDMDNIEKNIPVNSGFPIAFNAQTYDEVMQGFLEYIVKHQHEKALTNGLFSPWNYALPDNLDPLFYEMQSLINQAMDGWVSWDDKLDTATLLEMDEAQQELALSIITPDEFIAKMDRAIVKNNPKKSG